MGYLIIFFQDFQIIWLCVWLVKNIDELYFIFMNIHSFDLPLLAGASFFYAGLFSFYSSFYFWLFSFFFWPFSYTGYSSVSYSFYSYLPGLPLFFGGSFRDTNSLYCLDSNIFSYGIPLGFSFFFLSLPNFYTCFKYLL